MPETPETSVDRLDELSDEERAAIDALRDAVYPPDTIGDWPGKDIEWALGDRCVRAWNERRELVSYVGVLLRDVSHDNRPAHIGGVGGVKTHPDARQRGYAGCCLERAAEFFRETHDVTFSLLVCDARLTTYYSKFGWKEFGGRLLVAQGGALTEFTVQRVMVLDVAKAAPSGGTIDLRGLPW